jgi:hypothetical protein
MNYYINKNKILTTEADFSLTNRVSSDFNDSYEAFVQLNDEQIQFYELNPSASAREVFLVRLDIVIEPNLDELKSAKRKRIEDAYTNMSSSNFDNVITPMVFKGFELGYPKCSVTTGWVLQMYMERDDKIQIVLDSTTKEEVDAVIEGPSILTKPYTATELMVEYFTTPPTKGLTV